MRWCRLHASTLAVVLGAVSLMLAVLAAAQADLLYDHGSRLAMGTVPEWMAGAGTVATFAAVWVAVQQLRIGRNERDSLEAERQALAATREAERQDHVMSQARLIAVGSSTGAVGDQQLYIANHSEAPIFDLRIDPDSPVDATVKVHPAFARHSHQLPMLAPTGTTPPFVFAQGAGQLRLAPTEYVSFAFTDARGARWRRVGSAQPEQILGDDTAQS